MAVMPLSIAEFRTIVQQAPLLIWRAGLDAKCNYFNAGWLSFTGRTHEQEFGNGWAEGVHPDDLQRCLDTYLGAFKKRESFEMEYRLRRHDGVFRWLFDRGAPYVDENGAFAGYIGSCIDVTPRIEAQEALKIAHDRELRRLRGILSVCSHCQKIMNEQGAWETLETYVHNHAAVDFSHGICPDCQQKGGGQQSLGAVGLLKRKILVVDDQPTIIEAFTRFFLGKGFDVRGAGSAEEAIAVVDKEQFDVIFLDNVLPGMTGLRAIVDLKKSSAAPILMITGHFDEEFKKDALLMGALDSFSKPLNFAELEGRVTKIIGKSKTVR